MFTTKNYCGVFHEFAREQLYRAVLASAMDCNEICNQLNRIAQLGLLPARQRLEELLWQMIVALGLDSSSAKGIRLPLPLKNWEVAQLIAVTPPYLCRLFEELQREDIIQRSKGRILIVNPLKLAGLLRGKTPSH